MTTITLFSVCLSSFQLLFSLSSHDILFYLPFYSPEVLPLSHSLLQLMSPPRLSFVLLNSSPCIERSIFRSFTFSSLNFFLLPILISHFLRGQTRYIRLMPVPERVEQTLTCKRLIISYTTVRRQDIEI